MNTFMFPEVGYQYQSRQILNLIFAQAVMQSNAMVRAPLEGQDSSADFLFSKVVRTVATRLQKTCSDFLCVIVFIKVSRKLKTLNMVP